MIERCSYCAAVRAIESRDFEKGRDRGDELKIGDDALVLQLSATKVDLTAEPREKS